MQKCVDCVFLTVSATIVCVAVIEKTLAYIDKNLRSLS